MRTVATVGSLEEAQFLLYWFLLLHSERQADLDNSISERKLLEEQRATLGGSCVLLSRLFFPKLSTPFAELCGLVSRCCSVYTLAWSFLRFIYGVSFAVWIVRVPEGCAGSRSVRTLSPLFARSCSLWTLGLH